jgi:hypothetical protein
MHNHALVDTNTKLRTQRDERVCRRARSQKKNNKKKWKRARAEEVAAMWTSNRTCVDEYHLLGYDAV